MIPATHDLTLYRGDTARWQFRLWSDAAKTVPVDLTGVTVDAMIRDKTSGGNFFATLDCTVTQPNLIDMVLTSTAAADLAIKAGVWDLQLTYPSGDIITVLRGAVAVTEDVTNSKVVAVAKRNVSILR